MNKAKFKFGDKAFYDNFLVVVLGVNQTTEESRLDQRKSDLEEDLP